MTTYILTKPHNNKGKLLPAGTTINLNSTQAARLTGKIVNRAKHNNSNLVNNPMVLENKKLKETNFKLQEEIKILKTKNQELEATLKNARNS